MATWEDLKLNTYRKARKGEPTCTTCKYVAKDMGGYLGCHGPKGFSQKSGKTMVCSQYKKMVKKEKGGNGW